MPLGGAWSSWMELPMPARYPCLASWLLARRRKRVAACHGVLGLLIDKRHDLLVVTGRTSEPR